MRVAVEVDRQVAQLQLPDEPLATPREERRIGATDDALLPPGVPALDERHLTLTGERRERELQVATAVDRRDVDVELHRNVEHVVPLQPPPLLAAAAVVTPDGDVEEPEARV